MSACDKNCMQMTVDFKKVVICALLLRFGKKRRTGRVHPLISQRLVKDHLHKIYEDLTCVSQKIFYTSNQFLCVNISLLATFNHRERTKKPTG